MAFVLSFALFILGFYLFGLAFTLTSFQGLIFFAGIVAVCLSFGIPAHALAKR